ncbi:endo alpha-1,4 polygalactosaminidase [Actinosynnema sp. NPDC050436]|uniref:endo alpha-1,4 polygalactosaminidase n=1 Tax=Actinosynnema sp. NPDC050436 TaxID=3155659 RepID=UPI00340A31C3
MVDGVADRRFSRTLVIALSTVLLSVVGCDAVTQDRISPDPPARADGGLVYQLQNYSDGRLDTLAGTSSRFAVVDLARDAGHSYFEADEIARLRASGKTVLAYFEIGSIESFRPDFAPVAADRAGLILNEWTSWPGEHFVRYWEPSWWNLAVRPRLDRALEAGFDGVYLDTPLAYEEIDLALVGGLDRAELGRRMVDLIVRISEYAKRANPAFRVFPQNSPELLEYPGYLAAVDGIGVEELFFQATDKPCSADYCGTNLAATRTLRKAGKTVLAVDYATDPGNVAAACRRYREEGFEGYVTVRALDRISAPCR